MSRRTAWVCVAVGACALPLLPTTVFVAWHEIERLISWRKRHA